jgi:glycosyltransferase involved in cell wall biosynthesis
VSRSVVLVATNTADVSPLELQQRLRHLRSSGWDVRLLCRGERFGTIADRELGDRVTAVSRPRRRAGELVRPLRRFSPDVIHFHSAAAAAKVLARRGAPGGRVVVSLRDDGRDLELDDPQPVWRRADLLLFGHLAGLERAVARGWPRERSEVLSTPIPSVGRAAEPNGGPLRVLSAGPLLWEHGLEHSVHAIGLLREAGVPCRYVIVGEGDHLHAVAFARHQLGLAAEVELIVSSDRERVAEELGRTDVFLDPAVTDTTSRAPLIAARRCGLPSVATPRAGLEVDGGIVVPRRDPQAIARALATLAGDPELRQRLGREASRSVAPDDHLERLERLYSRLVPADA